MKLSFEDEPVLGARIKVIGVGAADPTPSTA